MHIFIPQDLKELFEIKNKNPDALIIAGGTDLMAQFHNIKKFPENIISISHLKDLSFIKEQNSFIEIGALTTHNAITSSKIVNKYIPVLSYAASTIGAPAIRNMGTIGGNIANASPAADLPPPLLCLDASLILTSSTSSRELKLYEFYRGYKNTALKSDEIIFSIKIPIPSSEEYIDFYKIGTRKAQSIAKLSLAGLIKKSKKGIETVRLAAGSVAPIPLRLFEVEKHLAQKMLTRSTISNSCDILIRYLKPITDVRSTEEYRKTALKNLLIKFLTKVSSI